MKFSLTIELANDAMRDPGDVAAALEHIANQLRDTGFGNIGDCWVVRDANGNGVGFWTVEE
jgi:hypothetical protein